MTITPTGIVSPFIKKPEITVFQKPQEVKLQAPQRVIQIPDAPFDVNLFAAAVIDRRI